MISRRNIQNASLLDYSWSNRFLTLAIAGILFLTMYPFELSHAKPHRHGAPFFLGSSGKAGGPLDIFLNILLFMPYGFGIGTKLLRRGTSRKATLIYTSLAGVLFSYAIEFTQLYVPFRDSGWQDVLTNTTGAFLGCVVAFLFGGWIFRHLSKVQWKVQTWITPPRLASVLVIYFGIWFIASAFLTRKISLQDWRSDCFLVLGNDASGRRPWNGKVLQVQIWNRALPNNVAEQLTSAPSTPVIDDPLVNFDFSGRHSSNGIGAGPQGGSQAVPIAASPTLSSYLVNRIKQANQFSIRAVLLPPAAAARNGRMLSLSQYSGFADFYISQQGDGILFWFRTPVVERHILDWKIPRALSTGAVRTIIFSYDGSVLSSYMDGKKIDARRLGVQTALAGYVRHLKDGELSGYRDIFYAFVFFPAGALLGLVLTAASWRSAERLAAFALWILLPALVFEWILMRATGAGFSIGNVALAVVCMVLGFLWMNSDGVVRSDRRAPAPTLPTPAK